jgi:DNA-binding MarR family transcriptional regulator
VTQWLTDSEQRTWRAFVDMNRYVMAAIDSQLQQDSDMPSAYYGILVALSEAPQRRMRMSALACSVDGSQSRLSHAVNRLEQRGWVRRERCPSDGRGWFAVLTDDGMTALESAAPGHVDCVRRTVFDVLSDDEQEDLYQVASVLAQHLRRPDQEGPAGC